MPLQGLDYHQVSVDQKERYNWEELPNGKWARIVTLTSSVTLGGVFITDPAGNPVDVEVVNGHRAVDVNVVGFPVIANIAVEHENDDITLYGTVDGGNPEVSSDHRAIRTDDYGRLILSPNVGGIVVDSTTTAPVVVTSSSTTVLQYIVPSGNYLSLSNIELTLYEGSFVEVRIEKIVSSVVKVLRWGRLSQAYPRDSFQFNAGDIDLLAGETLRISAKILGSNQEASVAASYSGRLN